MKLELIQKIAERSMQIIDGIQSRRKERKVKTKDKELVKLEKLYKKALKEGNIRDIVYYRDIISRRVPISKL